MSYDELFLPKFYKKIVSKCAYCKKFYAKNIDGIISLTTEDDFSCEVSHGICPSCTEEINSETDSE